MSKREDYITEHAAAACEQMKRYGIPASVILAQGIIESGDGQSELSRIHNNHFGIKATSQWIQEGGKIAIYTDDRPDEKFCSYPTVADSYDHHSRFLKENSRYASLFELSPDDHRGWAEGLQRAGYASSKSYAKTIESVIKANGLDKYDRQVMAEMQGKGVGVSANPLETISNGEHDKRERKYSFPIDCKEFLLVTSPFGMRRDPKDAERQQMHKGVDLRVNHGVLRATEDGGHVVEVTNDPKSGGGKSVTIEYGREDGSKMRVFCCHLESVDVKVGDVVQAGQQLGMTGNTGTRTTGPHLHLGVRQVSADGEARDIDPVSYLADIAEKGGINRQVLYNGENLLAKYMNPVSQAKNGDTVAMPEMSPQDWMSKLLSSEDAGATPSMSADPLLDLIVNIFSSLMALALSFDNKGKDEKMQTVTDSALSRTLDLSGLVPSARDCTLTWKEGHNPRIDANIGERQYSHVLTDSEAVNLNSVMQDTAKSDSEKQRSLNSLVAQIVLRQQLSDNYEHGIVQESSQSLQR